MATFRSLKSLDKFLKSRIKKALNDKPVQAVKNLMKRNIISEVYTVYSPTVYERRYSNKGLLDEKNIKVERKNTGVIEIFNVTKRNQNYTNHYLTPVIELGHEEAIAQGYKGYSVPNPKLAYYYPRPFIAKTRYELRTRKGHVHAMKQSLKKYGINVSE